MKVKPSALKNKTYRIILENGHAIVYRQEPPLLTVYYDPVQKCGELWSLPIYTTNNFLQKHINEAVQKTIAFAKENIIE
jgi:hypothetical protein